MRRSTTRTLAPKRLRKETLVATFAALAALAALPPLSAQSSSYQPGPAEGTPGESYGYVRTLEGRAELTTLEQAEPVEAEVNFPILTGDSLWVSPGSRVEIELADGNILRIEAGTEIVFEQLAFSPDSTEGAATHLRLLSGELQIYAPDAGVEPEPPLIESSNAQIYLLASGSYWIGIERGDETRTAVREGLAEALTSRGSVIARSGEEIRVAGRYAPYAEVRRASREREIEYWAATLEAEAYAAASSEVDSRLAYASAPLARSGRWVTVSGRRGWRPYVSVGWRPFTDGSWVYTPSGLTWVATEPWGWVTAHYGSWSFLSTYGWTWFPGHVYSPAWVYWYWGPTHVGWVPSGYYSHHYRERYGWSGFHFGVYGWAGGSWNFYSDWTFCPIRQFGHRRARPYWRSGHELARERRVLAVPRGVITTDTRLLKPSVWGKPSEVYRELVASRKGRIGSLKTRPGMISTSSELPDVTDFVGRRAVLTPESKRKASVLRERPTLRQARVREESIDRSSFESGKYMHRPSTLGSRSSTRLQGDRSSEPSRDSLEILSRKSYERPRPRGETGTTEDVSDVLRYRRKIAEENAEVRSQPPAARRVVESARSYAQSSKDRQSGPSVRKDSGSSRIKGSSGSSGSSTSRLRSSSPAPRSRAKASSPSRGSSKASASKSSASKSSGKSRKKG